MTSLRDNLRNKESWKKSLRAMAPPFAILLIFDNFSEPLRHFLGVSWAVMPSILLVALAPWLLLNIRKTWRETEREKQELEKRYEAEDRLISGQSRKI